MKAMLTCAIGVTVLLAVSGIARADDAGQFKAVLNGYSALPLPIFTPGAGEARLLVAEDKKSLEVVLKYSGLSSDATSARLYFARPAILGVALAPVCGESGKPACPARSGEVTVTITSADVAESTLQGVQKGDLAALIDAMEHGSVFIQVQTSKFAFGEIRGAFRRGMGESDGPNGPPSENPGQGHGKGRH